MPRNKDFDAFVKYLTTALVNTVKLALNVGLLKEKEDLIISCDTGEEIVISYGKPDAATREKPGWHLNH